MKKLIVWMGLGAGLFAASCSNDFLGLTDPNNVTEEVFWKNERDAILGLAGVFDVFQGNPLMGKKYREFDHLTDNSTTGQNQGWLSFETDTHTPSDNHVVAFWTNFYQVINRANEVMSKTANISADGISEASRLRIIAEAAFLRAYAYHDLVALYGDVPLYKTPKGAFDSPEAALPKEDIIAFFVVDLANNVVPNLSEELAAAEQGRIAKGAAQALLGKFLLLGEDWPAAAAAFQEVINSETYELYPDYAELFTVSGEFSSENLFEINFVGSALDQGENFSTRVDTNLAPSTPAIFWTPLKSLADSYLAADGKPIYEHPIYGEASPLYDASKPFENRDPRLRANLYTSADVTPGGKKVWNFTNNNSFAVKKYSTITSQQYENGGPQNYYAIRYADVLLMYAEAKNEADGPDQSVYDAVNAVRDRVHMPFLPEGLSQEAMRQYIRDERRWEFAFEHQRYFDLKRWRILGPISAAAMPNKKKYSEPRIFNWPYPLTEMDRNPALRGQGQNDGF
ncbi:RagB/SusD family nutrient uptake outer membrane protein [Parapedobacter deserti]|uniref:RagB/SusD family nutrient uptake outer membrane protein n=1 Tax=Parapedobacter deserti TaxID=1912957 RepID=A0ABV7JX52_9SPHI